MNLEGFYNYIASSGYVYRKVGYLTNTKVFKKLKDVTPLLTLKNPVSSERCELVITDKYLELIKIGASLQHLPMPIRLYTLSKVNGILQLSGIALTKTNPLPEIALLLKPFENELDLASSKETENFKFLINFHNDEFSFESGLLKVEKTDILKAMGYRKFTNLVYFKILSCSKRLL